MLSRRELLRTALGGVSLLGGAGNAFRRFGSEILPADVAAPASAARRAVLQDLREILRNAPRARYWTAPSIPGADCLACHDPGVDLSKHHDHTQNTVKCLLCPNECIIPDGQRGICRARMNAGGEMRSLVYGRPMATAVDPIEKKPFYHFLPGSEAFSLSTSGCPLRCRFCQNWQISQASPEDYDVDFTSAETVASTSAERKAEVIAFTYNEPTVFTEYLLDIAREGRKRGLRSVAVSCGYMNPQPLADICKHLDAIKVDLKGFSKSFYRDVCGAELEPVLRTIRTIARSKVHLEIVNLVVPTLNDSDESLRGLVGWVADEVGPDVPLHFSRFYPNYQLQNLPPTPVRTLERARELALAKGLRHVYIGNVPDHEGNHTYCPGCGKRVIERLGFFVVSMNLEGGRCRFCQRAVAGVWSQESQEPPERPER